MHCRDGGEREGEGEEKKEGEGERKGKCRSKTRRTNRKRATNINLMNITALTRGLRRKGVRAGAAAEGSASEYSPLESRDMQRLTIAKVQCPQSDAMTNADLKRTITRRAAECRAQLPLPVLPLSARRSDSSSSSRSDGLRSLEDAAASRGTDAEAGPPEISASRSLSGRRFR